MPVLQIFDLNVLKRINFSRAYSFHKTQMSRMLLLPLIGAEGLILVEGQKHRRLRKLTAPSLHHESVALLSATLLEEGERLVERFRKDVVENPRNPLELKKDVGKATFSAILRAFLPQSVLSKHRREKLQHCYLKIFDDVSTIYRDILLQMFLGFLLPVEWLSSERQAKEDVRREVKRIVDEALVDHGKSWEGANKRQKLQSDCASTSMMEIILSEAERNGQKFDSKELVDTILTFLAAGQGTSAMLISWALYRLARHPDWQSRLREEVDDCKEWKNKKATAETRMDALNKLPILNRIVKECLRLHPPAIVALREVVRNEKIGDYEIPAGVTVNIPILAIHMSPKHWDDPELFNPDRFLPELEAKRDKMAYCPFLFGPRGCIGQRFALLEIKSMLAFVVNALEISLDSSKKDPVMFGGFSGQPDVALYGKPTKGSV